MRLYVHVLIDLLTYFLDQEPPKAVVADEKLRVVKGAFNVETTSAKPTEAIEAGIYLFLLLVFGYSVCNECIELFCLPEIERAVMGLKIEFKKSIKKGIIYKCEVNVSGVDMKTLKDKVFIYISIFIFI